MKYLILFNLLFASCVAFSQSATNQPVSKPTDPIVVVDGKILPALVQSKTDPTKMVRAIDSVDGQDIDKIEVVNGSSAVADYGDTGKNGAIVIKLKKPKSN